MHLYRAYGLVVASERALPFSAAPAGSAPDMTFLYEPRSGETGLPSDGDRREFVCSHSGWSLRYFSPAGRWIGYDYAAGERVLRVSGNAEWDDIEMALIGVVCAVLLARRGRTLLHGAGIAWNGRAAAILGDSGSGKSTLAAAALREGARLLAEDLTVLEETGRGGVLAQAGYGRISLRADALAALGLDPASLRPRPGSDKCWVDTQDAGSASAQPAVPLAAIYMLEAPEAGAGGTAPVPVPSRRGALELVRHLYGASWIRPVEPADIAFCAELAARVPLFRLARAEGLASVPATARLLESHLAGL